MATLEQDQSPFVWTVLGAITHFAQASAIVTEDMVRQRIPCGSDPERHLAAIQAYVDAGYDEVHISRSAPTGKGCSSTGSTTRC